MGEFKILSDSLFDLFVKNPFYGVFLSELNKYFTDKTETGCVAKSENNTLIELWLNDKFFLSLSPEQRLTLLAHESQHIIFQHFTLGKLIGVNQKDFIQNSLFNISADFFINENLSKEGFEKITGGMYIEDYPGLNFKDHDTEYYYERTTQGFLDYKNTGTSGDKNFDIICQQLINEENNSSNSKKNLSSGDGEGEDENTNVQIPKHEGWDTFENDFENNIINKQIIDKLIEISESEKVPGSISVKIKELTTQIKVTTKKIKWQEVIRTFNATVVSSVLKRTKLKPNKRFPDARGTIPTFTCHLIYAIDSSGSMSDKQLNDIFNEAYYAKKLGIKITIIIWDTFIIEQYEYKGEKKFTRKSAGGTDVDCVLDYVNKNTSKYDGLVVFTDGYVSISKVPKINTLWIISEGTIDYIKKVIPKARYKHMD